MVRLFTADAYFKSVFEIDLPALKRLGKTVLAIDLDNTLASYAILEPTEQILAFLKAAEELGFTVIICSNNNKSRVRHFSKDINAVAHHHCLKPLPFKVAYVLRGYKRCEIVVIGDQIRTDILAAKLLGVYSILVDSIEDPNHWIENLIKRFVNN